MFDLLGPGVLPVLVFPELRSVFLKCHQTARKSVKQRQQKRLAQICQRERAGPQEEQSLVELGLLEDEEGLILLVLG